MGVLKTLTVNGIRYEVKPVVPTTSVSLIASRWVGEGTYSQVVGLSGITEHTKVDLQPTPDQVKTFLEKTLAFVAENNDGVVTVYSIGDKPTDNYTIQVTLTEVEGDAPIRGNTVGLPNPQPDWNQTDPTKADFIKNKPTFSGDGETLVGVLTINGVGPDENGNIDITLGGGEDLTDEEYNDLMSSLEEEV